MLGVVYLLYTSLTPSLIRSDAHDIRRDAIDRQPVVPLRNPLSDLDRASMRVRAVVREKAVIPPKDWMDVIYRSIEERESEPIELDSGLYELTNLADGLAAQLSRRGCEVRSLGIRPDPRGDKDPRLRARPPDSKHYQPMTEPPWRWRYLLFELRRGLSTQRVADGAVHSDGAKVVIEHAEGVREWYQSIPGGLEQGFQILSRPALSGVGELILQGIVDTDLRIERSERDRIVFRSQAELLEYGTLHVFDALGRVFNAWLSTSWQEGRMLINIHIDDSSAVYPLTVDPALLSAPLLGDTSEESAVGITQQGSEPAGEFGQLLEPTATPLTTPEPSVQAFADVGIFNIVRVTEVISTAGSGTWTAQYPPQGGVVDVE